MQLKTKLRYTTALVAAALSIAAVPAVNAATVTIANAGFESKFTSWENADSSSISSDERSGSKAAKITKSNGKFEQEVTVEANTDYELTAYILGYGKIGATVDGTRFTKTGGDDDNYEKVTVSFNSGSATSITIFGNYDEKSGRFDDFSLESVNTNNAETEETIEALETAESVETVVIANAGFESKMTSWEETNTSISSDQRSGSKAAKITKSSGKFEQSINVQENTDYELTAYILGYGEIGATVDGTDFTETSSDDSDDYQKVTVSFNSKSASSITIFGNYYEKTGRFDDFSLTSVGASEPVDEPVVEPIDESECTTVALVIDSAFDDGSNDGHGPESAIDKSTSEDSRWSSNGVGKTITFDLGVQADVKELAIQWYKGSERSSYFDIHTSENNDDWTSVLTSGMSSSADDSYETIDVMDTEARYVRVTGLGNSNGSSWNSIVEAKILGCATGATVDSEEETIEPEEETIEPEEETIEPEETVDQEEPVTVEPGSAEYPSDLMRNYAQWKITYPDGVEDKTLLEEQNEYFYINNEGNGIVFYAPVRSNNGTTKNSHYIRSELRERTSDGKSDIYWTTSGTHVAYSKQAITHLPTVKNHLVATQIHGNKDDGIDDAMVLRLEGEHLFLSFNGGKLRTDVTVKDDYVLGTVHELIFEVIDDKHYVYYSEDGKLNAAYTANNADKYLVKDGSKDYVMDLNYDQSYFKIGNYTQSNADKEGGETDEPDNYGEVVVYDFWVEHK